jgi:hypothetical protein
VQVHLDQEPVLRSRVTAPPLLTSTAPRVA